MTDIVIIAGGMGTRLMGVNGPIPKTLLKINGSTILDIIIATMDSVFEGHFHLIISAGIFYKHLKEYVQLNWADKEIDVVEAKYWREGNAATVLAAEELVSDDHFILQMSDHLFTRETYAQCVKSDKVPIPYVCAQPVDDGIPSYLDLDDATKILADESGAIKAIGKSIPQWNLIDMGVFKFPIDIFETIRHLPSETKSLSRCAELRIEQDQFYANIQPGAIWKDIDSSWDLDWANKMAKEGVWFR
ncbi:MAG: NTP transferase domain-containing protein [Candidatus Thorarchaeota archaeon]